jgi:hypothetical protein
MADTKDSLDREVVFCVPRIRYSTPDGRPTCPTLL